MYKDGRPTLDVVDSEAEVVKEIYGLYLDIDGLGTTAIASYLTNKGIPTRRPKPRPRHDSWHNSMVGKILSNSVYRGKFIHGRRSPDPIPVTVPPIVSNDVWEAAECKRKARRKHRLVAYDHPFLLQGLARCSGCGSVMARRRNSGGANKVYHYYRCSTARYDKVYRRKCQQHAIFPAAPIDADLWKWVKTLLNEPSRLRMEFQEYRSSLQSDDNPVRGKLAKKRKLISSTERGLPQLVYLFKKEKISET